MTDKTIVDVITYVQIVIEAVLAILVASVPFVIIGKFLAVLKSIDAHLRQLVEAVREFNPEE